MFELGKKVGNRGMPLPIEMLTDSIPGKFYHISIETTGVADEQKAANLLIQELLGKFKADVVWIKVDGKDIELQISGSPFVWAALIPFIPTILSIIGITVVLIAVYSIMAAIPGWAWGLLIVGLFLTFSGPGIVGAILPKKPKR